MCDTFVFVPDKSGQSVIFGKNSDREPNEAQQIVHYPALIRKNGRVKATFNEVECRREVNEVILSKPFQMWGAEMGVNEHGVAIGNEAVFTRISIPKKNSGLTGMDMVRLGLEAGRTAEDALSIIINYLETYGQDACGGYRDQNFYYHNSFIIADCKSAFVLETAGRFWVYKKVRGYRAISNGLSITTEFDGIAENAEDFALGKRWARSNEDFNFRKAFSAFWMPRLAKCDIRRSLSESRGTDLENSGILNALGILRSHSKEVFDPSGARPDSLCMHASGLFSPHQTTGSMVAELRPEGQPTVWLTGSSAPCLSLFKPFYFGSAALDESNFPAPGADPDDSYWWRSERFHREALKHYAFIIDEVRSDQRMMESSWVKRDTDAVYGTPGDKDDLSTDCIGDALAVIEGWQSALSVYAAEKRAGGGLLYKRFWRRQNRLTGI